MRKMMALILAITLTLGMLPISAFAAEPEETAEHAETAPETEAATEPETLPPETVPETIPPETEPVPQPSEETTVPTESVSEPTAEATEPEETEETIPEETEGTVPEETEEEMVLPEGLRFELPPAEATPCEDFENRIQPPYYFYRLALKESVEIYEGLAEISIVAGDSVSLENATVTAEKAGITILALTGEGIPVYNTAYVIVEAVDGTQADLAIKNSLVEDFEIPELGRDRTMGSCIYFYEGVSTWLDFTVSAPGAAYLSVSVNGGEWNTKEGADAVFTAQLENRQNIIGIRAFDADGRVATFYQTVDARLGVSETEVPEEPPEETLPEVRKEVLRACIERASGKEETDCTPEEWESIQAALGAARLVLENVDATQAEVDEAIQMLTAALGEVPTEEETQPEINKDALLTLVETVSEKEETDFTPEEWAAIQTALENARAVLENQDATQVDIDKAIQALTEALGEAPPEEETQPEVNKDALLTLVETVSEKEEADFTPEEWESIQIALESARLVLEKEDATQEEVEEALQALEMAAGVELPTEETEPTEEPTEPEEETQPEEDYDYALSKADEADLAEAEAVMELIREMGNDPRAIRFARAAYNGLTNLQQLLVQNYQDLLDAEEAIAELRATLSLPAEITGKPGTVLSAIVSVEGWNNAECYQVLDCAAEIPTELEVADVAMSERISGGSVYWNVSETDGLLRIVYTALSGETLSIDGEEFPAELFSIDMKVKEDIAISDTTELQLGLSEMSLKAAPVVSLLSMDNAEEADAEETESEEADAEETEVEGTETEETGEAPVNETFSVSIEDAVGVLYLIPDDQVSYSAVKLYQGDGEDLIAKGKKAVCISVAGNDAGKLTFQYDGRETTFFYSEAISGKSQTPSYVAVVDADVPIEVFNEVEYYTASKYEADTLMFGDANGDGVIDAQDALAALDIWLRSGGDEMEDASILCLNVNGDSRVNTFDALGILEHYVNGREFPVVTKAAEGGIPLKAEQTTEKQPEQ